MKEVDTEEWLRMSAPDDIRRHEMLRGFAGESGFWISVAASEDF